MNLFFAVHFEYGDLSFQMSGTTVRGVILLQHAGLPYRGIETAVSRAVSSAYSDIRHSSCGHDLAPYRGGLSCLRSKLERHSARPILF